MEIRGRGLVNSVSYKLTEFLKFSLAFVVGLWKDYKNIVVRCFVWLLVRITLSNFYLAFESFNLDVWHLNYTITSPFKQFPFTYTIQDLFLCYDRVDGEQLNVEWYFYFLGQRCKDAINAYMIVSLIGALSLMFRLSSITSTPLPDVYRVFYLIFKFSLAVELYNLLNYLLSYGQFMKGFTVPGYLVSFVFILFFYKTNDGWVIKPKL